MPVRLGYPQGLEGLKDEVNSPSYATTVGLLMHAREHLGDALTELSQPQGPGVSASNLLGRMKTWFNKSF